MNDIRKIGGNAVVIRSDEGEVKPDYANYILPGDVLIVPSTVAYLHEAKGLCFEDGTGVNGAVLSSDWLDKREKKDEVVMLRSAPSAMAFRERALILLEQGPREHGQIGTVHRNEDYNPSALLASIGEGRDFETFRDLFRMYLIQESTYKPKESEPKVSVADTSETNNLGEEEQQ